MLGSKSSAGIVFPKPHSEPRCRPARGFFLRGAGDRGSRGREHIHGCFFVSDCRLRSAFFPFVTSDRACGTRPELLRFGDLIDRKFHETKGLE